jgi:hypothetical protein
MNTRSANGINDQAHLRMYNQETIRKAQSDTYCHSPGEMGEEPLDCIGETEDGLHTR